VNDGVDDGGEGGAVARRRVRRGPGRLRFVLLAVAAVLVLALAFLWLMRVQLATSYIDGELARRGVQARYDVKRIGFGTQVFENLVIGDPRRPDLVARRVEVQLLVGFSGPYIGLITARGVRLRGRVADGRLWLGEVDKLLPPPSGLPFRLPDQRLDIADAAIALETPAGPVSLALAGRGNLSDGFRGGLALVAPELRFGQCRLAGPIARLSLNIVRGSPRVAGPAAMARLDCGEGLRVERPLMALSAALAPGLDGWRGTSAVRIASLAAGPQRLTAIQGRISFAGNAGATSGRMDIGAGPATIASVRAGRLGFQGLYAVSPRRGDFGLDGTISAGGLAFADGGAERIAAALRGARGTPVGPIADALANAVMAASGAAEGSGRVSMVSRGGHGRIVFPELSVASASGARLRVAGRRGLSYAWPTGGLGLDGDLSLGGGGFPEMRFALAQNGPGAPIEGRGRIAAMEAGGARLALGEVTFTAGPDGRTRFRTTALMSGPFPGGRVANLAVPISGRFGAGGFALNEGCVTAGFASLQIQGLAIGATRLPLCPFGRALLHSGPRGVEGGAELRAPRFAGHLGRVPVVIAAERLRLDTAGFAASGVSVRMGYIFRISKLDAAAIEGRFVPGGAAGRYQGLSGDLSNVPLLVSGGTGAWRLRGGALALEGRLAIDDRQQPLRFRQVASEDFRLTLVRNRIHATGMLTHPATGKRIALATVDHDLASGAGGAVLDVADLRFGPGFQPEALTPLTLGTIALVDGSLSGQGRIEWDAQGSRSTGTFSTEDMDLAAPFGPVEGLATRIHFTDLLGLTSAPGQEARVRLIRTGIDVHDGVVRYQLRPDYHVQVESARWPLAGGTLTLEPTLLDFSQESTKYLTFRVEALDAARFIQQMEFSNISATGTFDGIIPMQFTSAGGRVVDGRLAARPEGGTLSYVGELSDRDLGAYGVLAFDALKSLRYSRFDIRLDGALAGEFLTRIDLDGLARDPGAIRRPASGMSGIVFRRVLSQLARIPFKFNIRIEGRFRALVATARSFQDPRDLIRASLPGLLDNEPTGDSAVQAEESEPVQ
jgi:translocation and assembly module TamB